MKIFESHENTHQTVTSAKEDFNNPVARVTCSVDTIQLLSQPTLVISHGLVNKVTAVAGMEVYLHSATRASIPQG